MVGITLLLILLCLILFVTIRLIRSVYRRDPFASGQLLDHGIQTLLTELGSLKEQMKVRQRLALLGELSAAIIHQVRNPLAVMAGYARLIEKSAPTQEPIRDYAQAILEEIESINQIMEGLMKLSETGPLKRELFELNRLIEEIIKELDLDRSKLQVEVPELYVVGDRVLLRQALKNVIQNAVEAGSLVEIRAKENLKGDTHLLEIEDNGPGIPEEEKEKIFLPFYSKKDGVRGLGLPVAQKIIYSNGGTITVKDSPKGGAIFSITLPKGERCQGS